MATFGKICNGTVVQFNVLFIFVMAWCSFNATNLSRETLADIFEKQNEKQKLNIKNYEKIADYCFNILTSKLWSKY